MTLSNTLVPESTLRKPDRPAEWILAGLSKREWLIGLAVALLAGIIRLALSQHRSPWCDEYLTINTFRWSLPFLFEERFAAGHSPLYFIYARAAMLLGTELWQLRAPTIPTVSATVLFLTGLMGSLGLKRFLPVFWIVALVHPKWILLGTQVRYMMPLLAIGALTLWMAARHASNPIARNGLSLSAAATLLAWIHFSAQLIVLPLIVFMIWESRAVDEKWRIRVLLRRLWPLMLTVLLTIPFIVLIRNRRYEPQLRVPDTSNMLRTLLDTSFASHEMWPDLFSISRKPFLFLHLTVMLLAIFFGCRMLRQSHQRAWRMVASLLIGIPVIFIFFCITEQDYSGVSRYVVSLALPVAVLMAVAWDAPVRKPVRMVYRSLLAFVLLTQAIGAAFNRGDRHQEAIAWLMENHSGSERILASSHRFNRIAMSLQETPLPPELMFGFGTRDYDRQMLRNKIQEGFAEATRGFYIQYYTKTPLKRVLENLEEDRFLVGERSWKLHDRTRVGAVILDETERDWLESLPDPKMAWGPAEE